MSQKAKAGYQSIVGLVDRRTRLAIKLAIACLVLLLLQLSCTSSDVTSVQIRYAVGGQPDESCAVASGTTEKGGGSLNFAVPEALGNFVRYYIALSIISNLDNSESTAGGTTVNPGSRNDFYFTEMSLGYECRDSTSCAGFPSVPEQTIPIAGTILAGGELTLGLNLISAAAAEKIGAFLDDGMGAYVAVKIVLRGAFANGSKKDIPEYVFPVFMYRQEIIVRDPIKYDATVRDGADAPPCGNWGQDGTVPGFTCKSDCGGCASGLTCDTDSCSCTASTGT